MAFKCDVPPPPSKYSYSELGVSLSSNVVSDDDDDDDDEEEEEDNWLVTAVADYNLNEDCVSNSNNKQNESTKYTCQEWLENIEEKYLSNRDDLVRKTFHASFDNVADPYSFLLHVMYKAFFDLYSKRTPIIYYALDEMNVWLDLKKNMGDFVPMPADFQKKSALEFVYQKGYNYFNAITKIFQLDNKDNFFLAEVIELENLTCKKFKEAVIIVQALHLQSCFTAEQIMLPLLAFDQMQVLEGYINGDKNLQKDYLNLLNKLCTMSDEERNDYLCIDKSLVIKDKLKLQYKVLAKVGEKAVKHYNLNSDDYPEIFKAKNLAGLNYLINMRWKEENGDSIAIQKWDNMIEAAVADKVWLQQKLVEKYLDYNDLKSAMYWVHKIFLPPTHLPNTLLNEMKDYVKSYNDLYSSPDQSLTGDQEVSETVLIAEENWEEELESSPAIEFSLSSGFLSTEKAKSLEDRFYKLKIPLKDVLFVDTVLGLQEAEKILFKPGQVIGFDAEWKPTFGRAGEQDRVSILQLAVNDKVFIVDMLKLYVTDSAENVLREFFNKFFTSKHVVKIGYGIVGDLKILIGMFAYMKDLILGASHLVDLHEISDKVLKHAVTMPYLYPAQNSALSDKGLSLLINRLLGKSLDKTFQVSDWDKRPLTREQICYAALDAYCLLELFSVLKKIVLETKIQVNLIENVKMKWLKPAMVPIQRKDKYEKRNQQQKINFQKIIPIVKGMPRSASTLKVICDTMLDELGKQLRKCGIDTLIASSRNNSKIIQIAHQDGRVILTCRESYFMLRDHVPEGNCLSIQEGPLMEQVKFVFANYNLVLRSEDVFTRCPNCNTNDFVVVNSDEMNVAFKLKHDICDSKTLKVVAGSNLINLSNFTLSNNVEVQMDAITESCLSFMKRHSYEEFFRSIDFFKICRYCGEVYWKNLHDDVLRNEYRDFIDKSEVDKTFYGRPG